MRKPLSAKPCATAFWLYRQLENEYDWLTSDAAVDEAIHINAYTFTEAGLPRRLTCHR